MSEYKDKQLFNQLVPHFCPADRHLFQYKIMDEIHSFFQEKDIQYWAIGGTLLGAVKYSGTIPWDHDIDILCEKLKRNEELDLLDRLSTIEGAVGRQWLWSGRIPGMQIIDVRARKGIAIDIFYGHFFEDTIYTVGMNIPKFPEVGRQGIDRFVSPGNREVKFGNSVICVPDEKATEDYLDWKFANWRDEYSIFDFKEKTSTIFQTSEVLDEMIKQFVITRARE